MVATNRGIMGVDNVPVIDSGTMTRSCSAFPGVDVRTESHNRFLEGLISEFEPHPMSDRQISREFHSLLRDAIIDYQVDKRIDSLPSHKKNTIRLKKKNKSTGERYLTYPIKKHRSLNTVDSLVLHQMTINRGENPKGYHDLSVHFIITPKGVIYQNHDENVLCYGSSGFNKRSVSVEFVGHFKKDTGDWWPGSSLRSTLPTNQILAGRKLINYLRETLGIKYVFSHSQTNSNKANCPGPEIWFNVAKWCIDKYGLSDGGKGFKYPEGKPIPETWRSAEFKLL